MNAPAPALARFTPPSKAEEVHCAALLADADPAPSNLHPLMAEIIAMHFPLPAGPYPTAKWPDGCTHLPEGEKP